MVIKSAENHAFVVQRMIATDAQDLYINNLLCRNSKAYLAVEQGKSPEEETGCEQEYLGSECHGTDI